MIAHLDVDCFFAQVEEVRLNVRGRPLGVQQNMEIASVNYEARAFGLFNRISVEEGLRKCPDLVLIRGDNGINAMQRYRSAGQAVLRCVMQALDELHLPAPWVGRAVEHASFDDFFVQLPDCCASVDAALAWGERLRCLVMQATGLRCSLGLARTKLLSVLATKQAKPNGIHCCCGTASERDLLYAARIDKVCGAGLKGVPSNVKESLQRCLGRAATLGDARAWLQRGGSNADADLKECDVEVLQALLCNACDGSEVARFSLPRSLSVECSVRPSEYYAKPLSSTSPPIHNLIFWQARTCHDCMSCCRWIPAPCAPFTFARKRRRGHVRSPPAVAARGQMEAVSRRQRGRQNRFPAPKIIIALF
jgi:hypothetical protein